MADFTNPTASSVKFEGAWADSPLLSLGDFPSLLGTNATPRLAATSAVIVDLLREMEGSFFPHRSMALSRTVASILTASGIDGQDLQQLIRLLAKKNLAEAFFSLATPRFDSGLKRYLLDRGVEWDQVIYYYEFTGWDAAAAAAGFVAGMGVSVANTVIDLLNFLKKAFDFGLEEFRKPDKIERFLNFIAEVRKLEFQMLVGGISNELREWNAEFARAWMDLDAGKVGFMLGKLAADLFQLFQVVEILAKLPGLTGRALRALPRLAAKGARQSRAAIETCIEIAKSAGRALAELHTAAFDEFAKHFDNLGAVFEALRDGVLYYAEKTGNFFLYFPEDEMALASAPAGIGAGVYFGRIEDGVPKFIAKVLTPFEDAIKSRSDYIIQALKARFSSRAPKVIEPLDFATSVVMPLVRDWRKTVRDIFGWAEVKLNPATFGKYIHEHIKLAGAELRLAMQKLGPGWEVLTEKRLYDLSAALSLDGDALKIFNDRSKKKIWDFLTDPDRRARVFVALDVKSEKELELVLRSMGYESPRSIRLGALQSDLITFNADSRILLSLDYTSGGVLYRLGTRLRTLRLAMKHSTKAEIAKAAKKLTSDTLIHAKREYVVREIVLEHLLHGWSTAVEEVFYRGLGKSDYVSSCERSLKEAIEEAFD